RTPTRAGPALTQAPDRAVPRTAQGGGEAMKRAALIAALAAAVAAAPAAAADPGVWIKTSQLTKPAYYRQGIASNTATGDVFFSGSFAGLYRTPNGTEVVSNTSPIPKDVADSEKYNHIGDIDFDSGEGGRLLLPLESYT